MEEDVVEEEEVAEKSLRRKARCEGAQGGIRRNLMIVKKWGTK